MEHERRGEAFEGDIRLTVIGKQLEPGDTAPAFSLDALAPGEALPREVTLAGSAGRVRLLHVVNSLDTPVCHIGAHRFEQAVNDLPPLVDVYTVSMDLPFAQARWRAAEGVSHEALSSHRSEDFGRASGYLTDVVHPTFDEHPRMKFLSMSRSTLTPKAGVLAGSHTDEVLQRIGRDEGTIADLRDRKIVG